MEWEKVIHLVVIQSSPIRLCFSKGLWSLFNSECSQCSSSRPRCRRTCKVSLGDQPFPNMNKSDCYIDSLCSVTVGVAHKDNIEI